MRLVSPTAEHIHELMTWFPDEAAVRTWGGPEFRHPFTEKSFLEDARWGQMATYAMVDDESTMIGFGQLYLKLGRAHLARLAIAPDQRGKGHGAALIRLLADEGQKLFSCAENSLYVMRTNERALRCYVKAGFVEVAVPTGDRVYPNQVFMVRRAEGS